MKKLYTFSSIIGMLLLAPSVLADDYNVDGLKYTILSADDHTASVSGYEGTLPDHVVVPEVVTLDGTEYTVTQIGEVAFTRTSIKTISFPNTIERICMGSFENCTSLTSFTVPASVTCIEDFVLSHLEACTEYVIEDSDEPIYLGRENLRNGASFRCYMGRDIITDGLETHDFVFGGNWRVNSIVIGKGVTSIPEDYIFSCDELESVRFEEGCKEIVTYAIHNNPVLKEIILPSSVTKIGERSIASNPALTTLILPSEIEDLPDMLSGLKSLKSITIPPYVSTISHAFFSGTVIDEVRSQAIVPPVLDYNSTSFYNYAGCSSATLYVRPDCGDAYRTAPGWKDFGNIVESADVAAIEGVETDGSFDGPVRVINMGGVEVYSGAYDEMPRLQPGVYVVTDGLNSRKMIVKPL